MDYKTYVTTLVQEAEVRLRKVSLKEVKACCLDVGLEIMVGATVGYEKFTEGQGQSSRHAYLHNVTRNTKTDAAAIEDRSLKYTLSCIIALDYIRTDEEEFENLCKKELRVSAKKRTTVAVKVVSVQDTPTIKEELEQIAKNSVQKIGLSVTDAKQPDIYTPPNCDNKYTEKENPEKHIRLGDNFSQNDAPPPAQDVIITPEDVTYTKTGIIPEYHVHSPREAPSTDYEWRRRFPDIKLPTPVDVPSVRKEILRMPDTPIKTDADDFDSIAELIEMNKVTHETITGEYNVRGRFIPDKKWQDPYGSTGTIFRRFNELYKAELKKTKQLRPVFHGDPVEVRIAELILRAQRTSPLPKDFVLPPEAD